MNIFIKLKLFVFVLLCFYKEVASTETYITTDIKNTTNLTITLEPFTKDDIPTAGYEKSNGTEIPETAIQINKTENITTEGSTVSKKVSNVIVNAAVAISNSTESEKNNVIMSETVNTETTELPTETTKFSEVYFINVADEITTASTTVEKRDARKEIDPNDITAIPRVTKESHWSEDDAIDRFAEEAQTVRVTSKVKDQNWLKNQVELNADHDPFKRLKFKTSAESEGRSLTNLGYVSRLLPNYAYPNKNKDLKYSIDVKKIRFFDDSIIRPTHKVDRVRFHKNYPYDIKKVKEVRQVTTNLKKNYSMGDMYKPNVLSLIEALPGNSRKNLRYTPSNIMPGGYVNYQIPMSPERKIMKKFFRKIFETKTKSNASNFASYPKKGALVYMAPENNRGSKAYNKDMKEILEGISDGGGDARAILEDELFQKEKCELLKHVYITRSIDKKVTNLERLFLKLFGVIMNGGGGLYKETISIPKPTDDKQYYYIVSGNSPQKRSLQLIAEKPSKTINFVKVDCDKLGNCGLKRFRKSVSNEASTIDKEVHSNYASNDVSKMLDALLNATNEAMNKFNSTKFNKESSLEKDIEMKPVHITVYKGTNDTDKEIKAPVKRIQQFQQYQKVPVLQVTQKDFYPGQIGNYNITFKNKTNQYRFKKHRFIPSPKTEETLRKLKMLIHKYNLLENTFVRRLYESMKKAQKLNSTETQDAKTYVPQKRVYRNKYEMARHSKQITERLRMARDFAQTVQQQTRREKRQLKELTENQNHTLMLMDFLMDQDFPLEVTHEDDYVDFMTELVANAYYLKQPRKKTTTSKPKRKAPSYLQLSSEELSSTKPTKKNAKRNI